MFRRTGDSTTYIHDGLLQKKKDFEVKLTFDPDPSHAVDSDIIFCRFEIPINRPFLESLIEIEREGGRLFINSPRAKLYESTKRNLRHFVGQEWLPQTCITSDPYEAAEFMRSLEGKIVTKPTDQNGGKGVEIHDREKMSYRHALELAQRLTAQGTTQYVFQACIKDVEKLGDKRINVFMYEPVNAVLRLPKEGSKICNMSAGGSIERAVVTEKDLNMIEGMKPTLRALGITWAGIDVIGNYLTELNVSSPGALLEADELNGNTYGRDRVIELLIKHRIR
jgi:glutathione synthase